MGRLIPTDAEMAMISVGSQIMGGAMWWWHLGSWWGAALIITGLIQYAQAKSKRSGTRS